MPHWSWRKNLAVGYMLLLVVAAEVILQDYFVNQRYGGQPSPFVYGCMILVFATALCAGVAGKVMGLVELFRKRKSEQSRIRRKA